MAKRLLKFTSYYIIGNPYWMVRRTVSNDHNDWFPMKVFTIFGVPLTTLFFEVCGPFSSRKEVEQAIEKVKNGEYELKRV